MPNSGHSLVRRLCGVRDGVYLSNAPHSIIIEQSEGSAPAYCPSSRVGISATQNPHGHVVKSRKLPTY